MSTLTRSRTAQWFAQRFPPKATWPTVRKFCLHTTETPNRSRAGSKLWAWPGYDAGAKAPNATLLFDLQTETLHVRDHFPANASARALRNGPAVGETNAVPGGIHQVELIGTCSPQVSRDWQARGLRPDVDFVEWWRPPSWVLDALAAYWVDLHRRYGVPLKLGSSLWPAYPSSPEQDRRARMDRREFEAAGGLVGHLHVGDSNEHLDPGAFPAAELLRRALALAGGKPAAPTVPEDDMQLTDPIRLGAGAKADLKDADGVITTEDALRLAAQGGMASIRALRLVSQLVPAVARLASRLEVLSAAINAPGVLTFDELESAGEAGARRVLGELVESLTDAATDGPDAPAGR